MGFLEPNEWWQEFTIVATSNSDKLESTEFKIFCAAFTYSPYALLHSDNRLVISAPSNSRWNLFIIPMTRHIITHSSSNDPAHHAGHCKLPEITKRLGPLGKVCITDWKDPSRDNLPLIRCFWSLFFHVSGGRAHPDNHLPLQQHSPVGRELISWMLSLWTRHTTKHCQAANNVVVWCV